MNLFSNLFKRPAAKEAASDSMSATVTETGAVTGARPLVSNAHSGGYTPAKAAKILEAAERGAEFDLVEYFRLADYVLEREHHSSALIHKLALSVAGLPHKAMPPKGDDSRRARKIAEDVQAMLEPGGALRLATPALLTQGISHGLGVASVIWDTRSSAWVPADFVLKPAHFYCFSRLDGRTPMLRAETAGAAPQPLQPGLALAFTPRRSSALQIKNGLAWPLAWIYVLKSLTLANWTSFLEAFGHPVIYATHRAGASPKEVALIRNAVSQLSSVMRGVFSEDVKPTIEQIAQSSTDGYERLSRYLDELASKVVMANTLSVDSGGSGSGSYALGKVHAEGQYDVVRSYANQWAATVQQFVSVYVAWNYGADAPVPRITVDIEEDEDLVAGAEIVERLARAGVQLDADEVREKFGFKKPAPGAEVIGGTPAQATPNPAQGDGTAPAGAGQASQSMQQGCPVHSPQASGQAPARDALDDLADEMLADWADVASEIEEKFLEAAANATNLDTLREQLQAVVNSYDTAKLTALFAKARTKAAVGGDTGGEA